MLELAAISPVMEWWCIWELCC